MKNLFVLVFILFTFIMSSYSQDKFIELEDAVKILEKNDESSENLHYSLSNCHSLEQYDSFLYKKEMILIKEYENVEELITNLDENMINMINSFMLPGEIKCKIYLPVLKYQNRFFLKISWPDLYSYSEYIIELIEPQKLIISLIYYVHDNPAHNEIIEEKDAPWLK